MTKLLEDLFALQSLLRLGEATTPEQKAQIEALRVEVPAPILAHFLRQIASGRRGLVLVRNGICGECHLRLSHAMTHLLKNPSELLVCENCGAFLTLAPQESEAPAAVAAVTTPRRRPRKPQAVAYTAA